MKRTILVETTLFFALSLALAGCGGPAQGKTEDTGPQPTTVVPDMNADNFKVEHPEQFPLATADARTAAPELNVTGVVSADVSRQVPVPSLVSGRVFEIDARLGDVVKQGQILFKVRSTDVAGALSDYHKAVKNEQLAVDNERLAKITLDRQQLLFDKGAVAKSALEIAQNAEVGATTALENAKIDTQTTTEHLQLFGASPDKSTGIVEVTAPVSGVITDQQIAQSSGVQALTPPNPFTISDISHVWILCDVYENQLSQVHVGEYADVHLNAYPDKVLKARISNILPMMDPTLRTAKVRLEVENADSMLRFGMFVTATFHGTTSEQLAVVPATAILHLHDREWVYTPGEKGAFRRVEVVAGKTLPGNMQEILSGIKPGTQVISNALVFQNTVEQ